MVSADALYNFKHQLYRKVKVGYICLIAGTMGIGTGVGVNFLKVAEFPVLKIQFCDKMTTSRYFHHLLVN